MVAAVVISGLPKVPAIDAMGRPHPAISGGSVNHDMRAWGAKGVALKSKAPFNFILAERRRLMREERMRLRVRVAWGTRRSQR